jgi:hypothetical protein
MRCSIKTICAVVAVGLLFLLSGSVPSWGVDGKSIGSITAIEGEVYLSHRGDPAAFQAMLGDPIYLYDHVWTERQSLVQILFEDESLLNLAENTYIQITEHVYSPEKNWRSSLFRVVTGKVRAIVGRYFSAASTYKVSTPTAIIGVRGTHFIVDATLTDETTVVCVDTERDVAVRNASDDVAGEVVLTSRMMTKVLEGQPPMPPAPVPEDMMMRLLMDTRVMLPALQSGPGALTGLLGKEAVVGAPGVTGQGNMPPIPVAPDQPLFPPVKPIPPKIDQPLPVPPPPPPK